MSNPRRYTDEQLREAIETCPGWADVMSSLGKNRRTGSSSMRTVAHSLGIDTTHLDNRNHLKPKEAAEQIFTKGKKFGFLTGLSTASKWFLERGYLVSIPLEPAPYDLIADSDQGFQRIQVKTTSYRTQSGRYLARLTRTSYDVTAHLNTAGKYRSVAYDAGIIDYFFIVTDEQTKYLIPFNTVKGQLTVTLDHRYMGFKLDD